MKFLVLVTLFLTTNALAVEICSLQDTWSFHEAISSNGLKVIRVANDNEKFNSVEKKLIHKTVTGQSWRSGSSVQESLEAFEEGEILYFNIEGKQIILIHYWPGDNEYGAFFSLNKNGSFKLVAEINDGDISCR